MLEEGDSSGFLPSKLVYIKAAAYMMGDTCSFLHVSANPTYALDCAPTPVLCRPTHLVTRHHKPSSAAVNAMRVYTSARLSRGPGASISSGLHLYAVSIKLPTCMEESARSVTLDSPHNPIWLHDFSFVGTRPVFTGFILLK